MCRLAVLASHSLRRAGLVSLLKASGFAVVDEASTLDELQGAEERALPDILLVSLASEEVEIAGLMGAIRMWAPTTKVVFLSSHLNLTTLGECFAAGGSGYLIETISAEALHKSFDLIYTGECVFPSELASALIESIGPAAGSSAPDMNNCDLSSREVSILRLLSVGLSNKVIAARLNIAESTAKLYMRNILRKVRASNRTQAALWAVQRGILANDDAFPVAASKFPPSTTLAETAEKASVGFTLN